ncbi:MAG: DNA polymerase III subunit beta [Spirochaetaceae bacterium]|jgi:DNA polymerase-3 subunit beta|nr:DNA polymerase III subunit beta [Spirochaetaceae bacterium]
MKFTCERSVLLKEIAIAKEIISSNTNAVSVLSNIYIEAEEHGGLTIKATDMKVHFETKVPVTVADPGSTTVFGGSFLGIISSVPEGQLEFELTDSKITVKPANGKKKVKFHLRTIAAEQFPDFPQPDLERLFEIPVREFKEMIQQTVFAVSDDETRYQMNGVFFNKKDDVFVMVATDGRRLAFIKKDAPPSVADFEAGAVIPPKILQIVMKHAGDEGIIGVSVSKKQLFVRFGSYDLSSLLIEGTFPDYERVIPEAQSRVFTIDRTETLEALKRVSILAEKKSHRIYLGLLESGGLKVYAEESDQGYAEEEIPCKYDGDEMAIALNCRYIAEPFQVIDSKEISIHFTDPNKAITIKPEPEKDFFHIVMPMQP